MSTMFKKDGTSIYTGEVLDLTNNFVGKDFKPTPQINKHTKEEVYKYPMYLASTSVEELHKNEDNVIPWEDNPKRRIEVIQAEVLVAVTNQMQKMAGDEPWVKAIMTDLNGWMKAVGDCWTYDELASELTTGIENEEKDVSEKRNKHRSPKMKAKLDEIEESKEGRNTS